MLTMVQLALLAMNFDAGLLQQRLTELQACVEIPVMMAPEPMLPRQQVRLADHPELARLLAEGGHKRVGVLSRASPNHGIEATLSADGSCLVAGRLLARTDEEDGPAVSIGKCVNAQVRFVDLILADKLQAASSPSTRVVDLTARELGPLVERWLDLLAEKGGGSVVDDVVNALGALPGIDMPSERAFYIAALLNPYGCRDDAIADLENPCDSEACVASVWPAMEIRHTMLTAPTAMHRLAIAKTGLVDSIYKLKGGEWPMNSYYW